MSNHPNRGARARTRRALAEMVAALSEIEGRRSVRMSLRAPQLIECLVRSEIDASMADVAEAVTGDRESTVVADLLHILADLGMVRLYEPPVRSGSDAPRRMVDATTLRARFGL